MSDGKVVEEIYDLLVRHYGHLDSFERAKAAAQHGISLYASVVTAWILGSNPDEAEVMSVSNQLCNEMTTQAVDFIRRKFNREPPKGMFSEPSDN